MIAQSRRLAIVLCLIAGSCVLGMASCRGERAAWREDRGRTPGLEAASGAPDILIVLVDALRPDHLRCYGYGRATSPFLDRWAAGATRFEEAYTQATHTRMAIGSLFTGCRPTVHRIRDVDLRADHPDVPGRLTDTLSERFTTLAESLLAAGYETWGLSANPHVSAEFGFSQGFSRWWQTPSRKGEDLLAKFLEEWGGHRSQNAAAPPSGSSARHPLFVYLHLMAVHNPYTAPPPWNRAFPVARGRVVYRNGPLSVSPDDLEATVANYDGCIRHADDLLERLVSAWEGDGSRERVTIVLSDHGEEFQDHGGMGHGMSVFRELARIALIVKAPGLAAGVVREPVTTLDLHRLLVDVAHAAVPKEARGRSVSDWSSKEASDPVLYTESRNGWAAYRWNGMSLIFPRSDPSDAVWFDLTDDPREMRPRTDPKTIAMLRERLDRGLSEDKAIADALGTPTRTTLNEETMRALEGLGYLGR